MGQDVASPDEAGDDAVASGAVDVTGGEPAAPTRLRAHVAPRVLLLLSVCALASFAVCVRGAIGLFGFHGWPSTVLGCLLLLVGSTLCWICQDQYRRWVAARPSLWLTSHLVPAGVGFLMVVVGSVVLDAASSANSRWWAAFACAALVGGLTPIVHLIGTDRRTQPVASTVDASRTASPGRLKGNAASLVLNVGTIFVSLLPFVAVLGMPIGLAVVTGAVWLAGIYAGRVAVVRTPRAAVRAAAAATIALVALACVPLSSTWWIGGAIALALIWFSGIKFASLIVVALVERSAADVRARAPVAPHATGLRPVASTFFARRSAAGYGVALVVVGGVSLLVSLKASDALGDASTRTLLIVTVALLAYGATFVTRGEGFAVIALVSLVAVWAVRERDVGSPTWEATSGEKMIVVLGDSYSSGEGATAFLSGTDVEGGNNCRRAPTAYGVLVAEHFHRRVATFACSGALAKHIATVGQVPPELEIDDQRATPEDEQEARPIFSQTDGAGVVAGGRPQLNDISDDVASSDVELVLMSIGGNDAWFGKIGQACAMPLTCDEVSPSVDANLRVVEKSVTDALVAVATKFDHATIVLMAYPAVLGTESDAPEGSTGGTGVVRGEPSGAPLDAAELHYLRLFLISLNQTLGKAVTEANSQVRAAHPDLTADPIRWVLATQNAFDIDSPESAAPLADPMNMIRLAPTEGESVFDRVFPGSWIHDTFHPTEEGHRRIACVLERELRSFMGPGFNVQSDPGCAGVDTPGDPVAPDAGSALGQAAVPLQPASLPARGSDGSDVTRFRTAALVGSIRDLLCFQGAFLVCIGWLAALLVRLGVIGASVKAWMAAARAGTRSNVVRS